MVYTRNVRKISNVLSFIGGIISALLTVLFIMNSYTTFAFEVSIDEVNTVHVVKEA
jgi:hypothetical protein